MSFLFKLTGPVIRGDGRGKKIGFPTANIDLQNVSKIDLELGVYAAKTTVLGTEYKSALHLGPASTFGKHTVTFEVFILDFDQDIYDQIVTVEVVSKIRETAKFDSVTALVDQMNIDVLMTRKLLNGAS